jgi:hypothetical protein
LDPSFSVTDLSRTNNEPVLYQPWITIHIAKKHTINDDDWCRCSITIAIIVIAAIAASPATTTGPSVYGV